MNMAITIIVATTEAIIRKHKYQKATFNTISAFWLIQEIKKIHNFILHIIIINFITRNPNTTQKHMPMMHYIIPSVTVTPVMVTLTIINASSNYKL